MDDDYEDNQGSRPPSPSRVTDAVKDIMGKIVAKASARNYARQNTHFALYCFETAELRDCLLEPWFVEKLGECRNVSARKNMRSSVSKARMQKTITVLLCCPN